MFFSTLVAAMPRCTTRIRNREFFPGSYREMCATRMRSMDSRFFDELRTGFAEMTAAGGHAGPPTEQQYQSFFVEESAKIRVICG
jgi:hypothetical protein